MDWRLLPLLAAPWIGSFLGVLVVRLPAGRPVLFGRSACDHCGAKLAWYELLPIVSALSLRFRCRHCGEHIGGIHLVMELAALLPPLWSMFVLKGAAMLVADGIGWALCVGIVLAWRSGRRILAGGLATACGIVCALLWADAALPANFLIVSGILAGTLIALSLTDLSRMLLPDRITIPLAAAGLTLALWFPDPSLWSRLAGGLAGYASFAGLRQLYRHGTGRDGLGLGDAKLMAAAGTWLGWFALPSVVLIGSLAALLWALLRALHAPSSWRSPLPFGPALAMAFWLVWLYGPIVL